MISKSTCTELAHMVLNCRTLEDASAELHRALNEKSLTHRVTPGDIQSIAQEEGYFSIASDQYPKIFAELEKNFDATKGFNTEYILMVIDKILRTDPRFPEFCMFRHDVTPEWDQGELEKEGIRKMECWYMVDLGSATEESGETMYKPWYLGLAPDMRSGCFVHEISEELQNTMKWIDHYHQEALFTPEETKKMIEDTGCSWDPGPLDTADFNTPGKYRKLQDKAAAYFFSKITLPVTSKYSVIFAYPNDSNKETGIAHLEAMGAEQAALLFWHDEDHDHVRQNCAVIVAIVEGYINDLLPERYGDSYVDYDTWNNVTK